MRESPPAGARLLPTVVSLLPRMLEADQACAFLVRVEGDRRELEFFHGEGMPVGIGPAFRKWLQKAPKRFANYDPSRPDVRQRNVALRSEDISPRTPPVVHANAAGRALLDDDLTWVLDRQPAQSARLSADLQLVLLDPPPGDPAALAAQAAVRWSLTPRQAEVLRLVGQGRSNRALAAEL